MILSRRAVLQAATLLPALGALPGSLLASPGTGFTHSVASGDPDVSSVRLWTRFVDELQTSELRIEVSTTESFTAPMRVATCLAGPETDFCAQARIGDLAAGRTYFYRFIGPRGEVSPIGRTRTLPTGDVDRCRIAVVSCANATSGWFNAYEHAAARDDIDLVVHLGDYIYESPVDRSDALAGLALARGIEPLGETVSLLEYRLRYASYRADRALQELHRLHPMIVIWDDHETANNSWQNGASNHDPDEGPWEARKRAALRAFYEWLPMERQPYATYRIGNLATLFRLETRLVARSQQLDSKAALVGQKDMATAVAQFVRGPLADPARTMMGAEQEAWLARGMAESSAVGVGWQVLLQQVIMAPTRLPKIDSTWFPPGVEISEEQQRELALGHRLSDAGVPFGLDRWDGYPAARDRLLSAASEAEADLVVLSGDSHNAWASDLSHRGAPAGVEFAVQGVSSLGLERRFGGNPTHIAREFQSANPGLAWCDTSQRGYMDVEFTSRAATSTWHFLPSRSERSTRILGKTALSVQRGSNLIAR
ncbi:alkaline phosphatase D family protein [Qipengyuania sp.]|uniref:alkaline phosphatase D family protein n=1 Tax=Qipengyuania sp. TaxID=2004515 RepID=UPI0035C86A88